MEKEKAFSVDSFINRLGNTHGQLQLKNGAQFEYSYSGGQLFTRVIFNDHSELYIFNQDNKLSKIFSDKKFSVLGVNMENGSCDIESDRRFNREKITQQASSFFGKNLPLHITFF